MSNGYETKLINLGSSRAQDSLRVVRLKGSAKATMLILPGLDSILFWDGKPISVETGQMVYWHVPERKAALARVINAHGSNLPHVNCSASSFDFVVGGLLTKAGMQLVRKEER